MNARVTFAALIMAATCLVVPQTIASPTQASATAYTWVKHTNASGFNQRIMVKCHTTLDWRTLYIGDTSGQVCGQNGWVNSIWVPDGGYLECQNANTGHITEYGNHYKGSIGGGTYYCWVLDFP